MQCVRKACSTRLSAESQSYGGLSRSRPKAPFAIDVANKSEAKCAVEAASGGLHRPVAVQLDAVGLDGD